MKSRKKNILIIGGTGFIGYHLAKACLSKKFNVFSFSSSRPKKIRTLSRVKYLIGRLENKNDLKKFDKIVFDYVVNCGGYVDHKNKKKTYKSHYLGSLNLYYYFKEKNLVKFVQIGSSAEYGKMQSPLKESAKPKPTEIYGKSKLLASNFLIKKYKKEKFPVVILRFFQIFGNKQDPNRFIPFVIDECLSNNYFDCSICTQKRDFLYIDDAIKAILLSIRKKNIIGKIINIGSGNPITLKDIIFKIIGIVKKGKPNFGKIKLRLDENKIIFPDLRVAKKNLGWKVKNNFNLSLRKTINSYKYLKAK